MSTTIRIIHECECSRSTTKSTCSKALIFEHGSTPVSTHPTQPSLYSPLPPSCAQIRRGWGRGCWVLHNLSAFVKLLPYSLLSRLVGSSHSLPLLRYVVPRPHFFNKFLFFRVLFDKITSMVSFKQRAYNHNGVHTCANLRTEITNVFLSC